MGARNRVAVVAFGIGAALGAVLAQHSIGRHRMDLFSTRPLRRLSALGYLSAHPSVDSVQLLRDYLAWEQHSMLRRRAQAVLRRMEAKLG